MSHFVIFLKIVAANVIIQDWNPAIKSYYWAWAFILGCKPFIASLKALIRFLLISHTCQLFVSLWSRSSPILTGPL